MSYKFMSTIIVAEIVIIKQKTPNPRVEPT
jgi:hypothetical protein